MTQIYAGLPFATLAFIGLIIFLAVVFHIAYNEKAAAFGPTILTTTGILATFVGIAVGLSKFDTSNIQASVPDLLSGLKTAFWGSVAGVGAALSLKFRVTAQVLSSHHDFLADLPGRGNRFPIQDLDGR